jgi:hypothetical protein
MRRVLTAGAQTVHLAPRQRGCSTTLPCVAAWLCCCVAALLCCCVAALRSHAWLLVTTSGSWCHGGQLSPSQQPSWHGVPPCAPGHTAASCMPLLAAGVDHRGGKRGHGCVCAGRPDGFVQVHEALQALQTEGHHGKGSHGYVSHHDSAMPQCCPSPCPRVAEAGPMPTPSPWRNQAGTDLRLLSVLGIWAVQGTQVVQRCSTGV